MTNAVATRQDDTGQAKIGNERVFADHELGRNGNPPPFAYQRRIGTLGEAPARSKRWRQDYLEVVQLAQGRGEISAKAHSVASTMAAMSNAHGKDIGDNRYVEPGLEFCVSEKYIGSKVHREAGISFGAKWASDRLDELHAAGFIASDHGTEEDRYDANRRQRLSGRWQTTAIYRLMIPAKYEEELRRRRSDAASTSRKRHTESNRKGSRTTPSAPPSRPVTNEPHHPNAEAQARTTAAGIARSANTTSFEAGRAELEGQFSDPSLYMAAYDEYERIWNQQRRRAP